MTKLITIYGKDKTFQQLQQQIADAPKDVNILITKLDSNLYDGLVDFYENSTCH